MFIKKKKNKKKKNHSQKERVTQIILYILNQTGPTSTDTKPNWPNINRYKTKLAQHQPIQNQTGPTSTDTKPNWPNINRYKTKLAQHQPIQSQDNTILIPANTELSAQYWPSLYQAELLYSHNDINNNDNTNTGWLISDTNGLLISGFCPWWHKERDTILKSLCQQHYADPNTVHLMVCKISTHLCWSRPNWSVLIRSEKSSCTVQRWNVNSVFSKS